MAQEPARQQRRRRDHGRRRRRPQPQLAEHFKYDEEGSSSIFSSETYRGPAPASEAETQRAEGAVRPVGFEFQVNWHSDGRWLLYAGGLAGQHADGGRPDLLRAVGQPRPPGDRGLPPGPELGRPLRHQRRDDGLRARGDRRAGVDAGAEPRAAPTAASCSPTTRRWSRRSSSATCRSRSRSRTRRPIPDDPKSSLGHRDQAVLHPQRRPVQGGASRARTSRSSTPTAIRSRCRCWPSARSARVDGEVPDQRRRACAARRPRSGRAASATRRADVYYRVMRGTVTGRHRVTRSRSGSRAAARAQRVVHLPGRLRVRQPHAGRGGGGLPGRLARADRRGRSTCSTTSTRWRPTASPPTSTTSTRAAASRRTSSACSATTTASSGTRATTSSPVTAGRGAGNADRLALDEMLEARAYMNEGGRMLYTGKRAGMQYTGVGGVGTQFYDPKGEAAVHPGHPALGPAAVPAAARLAEGGDLIQDVLEYWFGGFVQIAGDGQDAERRRCSTSTASTTRSRPVVGLQRRRRARTTRTRVVVRDDERRPAARASTRSSGAGRRRAGRSRAGRSTRTAATQYVYSQLADVVVQAAHAGDRRAGRRRRA